MPRSCALWAFRVALGLLLLTGTARVSPADDGVSARSEISAAEDYRVRLNAALVLGRLRPAGAREALERALWDAHQAVRTAAAAALTSVGEPSSITALERRMGQEPAAAARSQMRLSIDTLKRLAVVSKAKYVLQLGTMSNNTGVRGSELGDVMRDAAKARAAAIPGVMLADGADREALRIAAQRQVPVLTLDGSLTGLTQGRSGGNVTFRAQVMFSLRKDQTLKASLTGAATAYDGAYVLGNKARIVELQNDAVDGAVQSALRGVDAGMTIASR